MNNNHVIEYLNENEYKKKERAIKKYNMLAYKKLIFKCLEFANFDIKVLK